MEAAEAAAGAAAAKAPAEALSKPPASAGLSHVSALVCKARLQWLKVRVFACLRAFILRDVSPLAAGPLLALACRAALRHWCCAECAPKYSACS